MKKEEEAPVDLHVNSEHEIDVTPNKVSFSSSFLFLSFSLSSASSFLLLFCLFNGVLDGPTEEDARGGEGTGKREREQCEEGRVDVRGAVSSCTRVDGTQEEGRGEGRREGEGEGRGRGGEEGRRRRQQGGEE